MSATHELIAQDVGGPEVKVVEGSDRLCQSRMVSEAGAMIQAGWWADVIVYDQITVTGPDPDDPRRTHFKMRSL